VLLVSKSGSGQFGSHEIEKRKEKVAFGSYLSLIHSFPTPDIQI